MCHWNLEIWKDFVSIDNAEVNDSVSWHKLKNIPGKHVLGSMICNLCVWKVIVFVIPDIYVLYQVTNGIVFRLWNIHGAYKGFKHPPFPWWPRNYLLFWSTEWIISIEARENFFHGFNFTIRNEDYASDGTGNILLVEYSYKIGGILEFSGLGLCSHDAYDIQTLDCR